MPSRSKRVESTPEIKAERARREVSKRRVREAELETWRRNGGGLPALKGRGVHRKMTPAEYQRAFGRPMPTELVD